MNRLRRELGRMQTLCGPRAAPPANHAIQCRSELSSSNQQASIVVLGYGGASRRRGLDSHWKTHHRAWHNSPHGCSRRSNATSCTRLQGHSSATHTVSSICAWTPWPGRRVPQATDGATLPNHRSAAPKLERAPIGSQWPSEARMYPGSQTETWTHPSLPPRWHPRPILCRGSYQASELCALSVERSEQHWSVSAASKPRRTHGMRYAPRTCPPDSWNQVPRLPPARGRITKSPSKSSTLCMRAYPARP